MTKQYIKEHMKPLVIAAAVIFILILDAFNVIYIPEWVGAILGGLAVYWMKPKISKTTTAKVANPVTKAAARKPRKKAVVLADFVKKKE